MNHTEPEYKNPGNINVYLEKIGIYKRYHKVEKTRIYIKDEIEKFVNNLEKNIKAGNGMIISGPVGTGKTTILSFIAQENFKLRNNITMDEDCDLLLLDDFGKEYTHDYSLKEFEEFVEIRYAKMKSTIVTTNLTPKQLNELVAYRRIVDRWKDFGQQMVTIQKESQRGKYGY